MAARKTIAVEDVRDMVNRALAFPDTFHRVEGMTPEQAMRIGVASLMEQILHATGNYRGFGYLVSELTEDGTLREGHDDSRRRYF